ncbi:RWD domain-containing protein 3 isoform X2 [Myripristis murdjan]|uniref:RWD domain-containing protein 3 isoform X2 n=1 Tax=Myripristis murdjan TaxID=586833 RepID=UPI001175E0C0|nr:RWD domain-containing protein 3 isoform X2 [Myripristis murdjan]
MSEAALEELSVLSSIYCAEGEFQLLQQSVEDGLVVQIKISAGPDGGLEVCLLFRLPPGYPSCLPDISVSSSALSRGRCHHIRQKLLDQAAALPQEPMVHQLVEWLQQSGELTEAGRVCEEQVMEGGEEHEQWTTVLLLDHIRSRNRYVRLLERWSLQLQLTVTLLLGRPILVLLQGARPSIKEFCHLLRTVKVDVDSSGRKCKERMMKVLSETPSSSSKHGPPGLQVKEYESVSELTAAFQELSMTELYQQILPSLTD